MIPDMVRKLLTEAENMLDEADGQNLGQLARALELFRAGKLGMCLSYLETSRFIDAANVVIGQKIDGVIVDIAARNKRLYSDLERNVLDDLNVRTYNALDAARILTLRDLLSRNEKELREVRGVGKGMIAHIKEVLLKHHLHFCMTHDEICKVAEFRLK